MLLLFGLQYSVVAVLEDAGYTCPVVDSFLDVSIVAFHSTCHQPVTHAVPFAPETQVLLAPLISQGSTYILNQLRMYVY